MDGRESTRRSVLKWGGYGAIGCAGTLLGTRSARASGWMEDAPEKSFSVFNAHVFGPDGTTIRGGIRVDNGVISEVGSGVRSGLDLNGAWVVPGLTDAGCRVGLYEIGAEQATRDDREESGAVVPDARVIDSYNPLSATVETVRSVGFAHGLIHPTASGLVSGQAAIVRFVGRTVADASLQAPAGLNIHLGSGGKGNGGPSSRMGIARELRSLLDDAPVEPASEPPKSRRQRKQTVVDGDDERSAEETVWAAVRSGQLPVLFHADRADDLLQAVALTKEYSLKAVLVGGAEGWLVAQELAEAGLPLLLGPPMTQPDTFERRYARYDNAALLSQAGLQLAFRSGANHHARGLRTDVGVLVAHGLPWEVAMLGLTSTFGEIFGVDGHGKIEEGAPATFFVSGGDPLQPRYGVDRMWIDGRAVDLQTRQTRLRDRFETLR